MSEFDESAAVDGAELTEAEAQAIANPAEETESIEDAAPVDEDGEEAEEEAPVEEIEFDFGGNKLKVPKGAIPEELAAEIDKFTKGTWSDYTRKSQAVSEKAKDIEARYTAVAKMESLNGEALNTYSQGLQVKAELEQLMGIDLNALWQSNPDQARHVSDLRAQKQAEFNGIVQKVSQTEHQLTQAQQAEMDRIAAQGEALLEKRVKGFSAKVPEIIDYVSDTYGIDKAHAAKVWRADPATAEMAYKAMMFDRMQASAGKPASPAKAQASPVPAMKTKGAASGSSDPENMTPAQMARYLGIGR